MASTINYLSINENFPVAGQDNDTQIFRDNFDTIKTSLASAKSEITALQDNSAKLNETNDFELNVVSRALLQNNRTQKFDAGTVSQSPTTVDYENGNYQIFRVSANITIDFLNFPGDPVFSTEVTPIGMGKVTLELYNSGSVNHTVNFQSSGGTVFKKDPDFPALLTLNSTSDPHFVEVWRHSADKIFLKYLGQYS